VNLVQLRVRQACSGRLFSRKLCATRKSEGIDTALLSSEVALSRFCPSLSTILVNSVAAAALLAASACAQQAPADSARSARPGEPHARGQEASRIADNRYSDDDVAFMQGMIHHHGQAVEMAALVQGRSATSSIVDLAGRINASQADEIAFMQTWLRERGEDAPAPSAADDMRTCGCRDMTPLNTALMQACREWRPRRSWRS
jgi:uncharacterized protein (DUF305 family)